MSPSQVGTVGHRVDLLNRSDVATDGRLLSVAEIQHAFRELQPRKSSQRASLLVPPHRQVVATPDDGAALIGTERLGVPDRGSEPAVTHGADLDRAWVGVVAAHAGAGASTVALAVADAAAAAGRAAHIVETALPIRSGLVGAANAELGLDASGAWRRGSRGQVTIDRRAGDDTPTGWPVLAASEDGLVVIDLGLPRPDSLIQLATSGCRVVVVCRPTVPGVRQAEQILTSLTGPVIVAAIGGGKWPGEVTASLGPRLRELRAADAVVTVPADRHLQVAGPTDSPLPKAVTAAGWTALRLIDTARTSEVAAITRSASRRKERSR